MSDEPQTVDESPLRAWLESREFYELMQAYRHAPVVPQSAVAEAYAAVQEAIVEQALKCFAERRTDG